MKLLTKALLKEFAKQGDTDDMRPENIKIIAKFFNPAGAGNWYAAEYDPTREVFFGFVSIFNDPACDELGYFPLSDLKDYKGPLGIGIERDLHFGEHMLREVMDGARP